MTDVTQNIARLGGAFEDFKDRNDGRVDNLEQRIGVMEADQGARQHEHLIGGNYGGREAREFLQGIITRQPQAAINITTATSGGNAAPEILSREVQNMVRRLSPMVDLVTVEQSTTGQYAKIVTDIKHASGWAAEDGTRSETGTATINKVSPTFGTLYAYPKASEESVMDIEAFNVERWFVEESSRAFAAALGAAIVAGNGTARPTGFLNGTAVSPQTIVNTTDTASLDFHGSEFT